MTRRNALTAALRARYGPVGIPDDAMGWDCWPCPDCGSGDGDYKPLRITEDGAAMCAVTGCDATADRVFDALAVPANQRPGAVTEMVDDIPFKRGKSSSTIISGVRTVGQLATNGAEVDWLWHGYFATDALVLLAAKPKAGKSTLLFALLAALESGSDLVGLPTRRARVLYVSEESEAQLRRKADHAGLSHDWHRMLARKHTWGESWPVIVETAGEIAHQEDCEAVVFDTFNGLARLRGDDENKAGATLEAVEPLHGLKGQGLGVLLVAHERKSEGTGVDTVRGANALTGDVDLIATLGRPPGGPETQRRIEAVGRFDETPPTRDIDYCSRSGAYTTTDAPIVAKARAKSGASLDALRSMPGPATAKEYAAAQGDMSDRTAKRHLDALVDRGLADRCGGTSKSDPTRYAPAEMMVDDDRCLSNGTVDDHPSLMEASDPDPPDVRACRETGHPVRPHPATGKPTCAKCHGIDGRLVGEDVAA